MDIEREHEENLQNPEEKVNLSQEFSFARSMWNVRLMDWDFLIGNLQATSVLLEMRLLTGAPNFHVDSTSRQTA